MTRCIWRGLLHATVVLLLSGCVGPQIAHPQLSVLDKGLSKAEAVSRLGLPPLSTHAASVTSRTFDFHRYRLNNGMFAELYLLAYEREKLIFWGYISEFRRQPDTGLNLALDMVLHEIIAVGQ
ncbi:hypothetical protein [Immundisolibacter sp.]|uniref:hypothetical protein n=1 Tax=Immundisolibacter sp. TaxID=1934948 RepID=UPI003568C747